MRQFISRSNLHSAKKPVSDSESEAKAKNKQSPLHLVLYNNPCVELEQLTEKIIENGNIPVVWSKSSGLMVKNLSKQYPLFGDDKTAQLCDSKEIIKFIISKPQNRISYILEDFHHYIGAKDEVNEALGEIRSMIKDLYRNLNDDRDDQVYFFVPSFYEMPLELLSFFKQMQPKQKMERKGFLDKYGKLLTDKDYISKAKPIIGCNDLIVRLIQILSQLESNNPLLIGHPGVGKTAIVEGLAKKIIENDIPERLGGKLIYSLSLNSLVAGTRYRGDMEVRLEGLMEEVLQNKDKIIVFIDEIHTLVDAGSSEGASSAGEILKPLLSKGEFPCIGATTMEGASYFAKDAALSRRFKKVIVNAATPEDSVYILRGISKCFENHHKIKISDKALCSAVLLSEQYLKDEYLPGKAISLIDSASSYCSLRGKYKLTEKDVLKEIERMGKT